MSAIAMLHDTDPREKLLKEVGDLSGIEIFNNQVLIATYIRPKRTAGGIIMTDNVISEDRYQSKIGLILARGAAAFDVSEDSPWFKDITVNDGDWIIYRASDGWEMSINGHSCRLLEDTAIRGRVNHPDRIF